MDTRFHTRSAHFTQGTTFYISRAARAPREALFGLKVHQDGHFNAKFGHIDTKVKFLKDVKIN